MNQKRTVAVAGGAGFVGRHIVRELLGRGHSVRALVRDRRAAEKILKAPSSLKLVEGDALDRSSLDELVEGADACINAIGIIREAGAQTFQKMHAGVTRSLIAACREAGANRFVLVSALGVHDEGKTAYQRTKFEAEQSLRRSELEWTILRPSMIHGPGSKFLEIAKGWVRGTSQPWFFLPYFTRGVLSDFDIPLAAINRVDPRVQPVAVEDVAVAAAAALERAESIGEVYCLVGSEVLTWPQLLRHLRDHIPHAEQSLAPFGIRAEMAVGVARVARLMGVGSLLPFDEGMAYMGSQDSTASMAKAREHLGLEPRPFRETFASYASGL